MMAPALFLALSGDTIARSRPPAVSPVLGIEHGGDRFWYQEIFSGKELREVESTRLADVIRRNTAIGKEIRDDVFHVDGWGNGGHGGASK